MKKGTLQEIDEIVEASFSAVKKKFLGTGNGAYVPFLTLPGLIKAICRKYGVEPNLTTINKILAISSAYFDSLKLRTKAQLLSELEAASKNKRFSKNKARTIISDILTKVGPSLKLIVESEVQKAKNVAILEGIIATSKNRGISDPTVYFVVVRDAKTCSNCIRLHTIGSKPRVYKLSKLSHGYYKKGSDVPSVLGLHPNCRCQIQVLPPGHGFNDRGEPVHIDQEHDEHKARSS